MKVDDAVVARAAARGCFSAEELGVLWALQIKDHRISLEQRHDGAQMAVLRPYWEPDDVAATLAKGAGTTCLLTSYRGAAGGSEPELEAVFPSFAVAVFALGAVFSTERQT